MMMAIMSMIVMITIMIMMKMMITLVREAVIYVLAEFVR